jgi:hypothetical protein
MSVGGRFRWRLYNLTAAPDSPSWLADGVRLGWRLKPSTLASCSNAFSHYGTVDFRTGKDTVSFFERLRAEASAEWRAYTEHPFTNGMADGSLPEAAFCHYLVQDYLFLIEFARAYALSVYKSPSLADMREGA